MLEDLFHQKLIKKLNKNLYKYKKKNSLDPWEITMTIISNKTLKFITKQKFSRDQQEIIKTQSINKKAFKLVLNVFQDRFFKKLSQKNKE